MAPAHVQYLDRGAAEAPLPPVGSIRARTLKELERASL